MPLETPGTAPARKRDNEAGAIRSRVRNPRLDEARDAVGGVKGRRFQMGLEKYDAKLAALAQLVLFALVAAGGDADASPAIAGVSRRRWRSLAKFVLRESTISGRAG